MIHDATSATVLDLDTECVEELHSYIAASNPKPARLITTTPSPRDAASALPTPPATPNDDDAHFDLVRRSPPVSRARLAVTSVFEVGRDTLAVLSIAALISYAGPLCLVYAAAHTILRGGKCSCRC
ncbi:hypothetical protein CYLTODRAFT_495336 [Cylindrobasidium torrendii FP15055 ss-10]|uniref:Uncharacterized protein n=1 Tax=Cylindrobasidium torrendii FP15055 ss-10 TaxID=1314674 RepID=A0A0D7AST2_9AGAR|nr:hypothetical protein CYLTODRAFT_495336 [Cylindrobasidium torrendii FP15055 ss-10]